MLAAIRPDAWNLPLLVHVAGAMLVVGSLVVVLAASAGAARRRDDAAALTRVGFRALLLGVIPSYLVMRGGAEWVASAEEVGDAGWIGIGYAVADGSLLVAIIATVLAWRASRAGDRPGVAARAVAVLSAVLLAAYVVAIWAMTAKPA